MRTTLCLTAVALALAAAAAARADEKADTRAVIDKAIRAMGGADKLGEVKALTFKVKGRTRTVYVPLDLLDEVRSWLQEHKRIKALLGEIHELTVALVRTHAAHNKRKQGRP